MPFRPIAPSKDIDTSSLQGLGKSVVDVTQWSYVQFNAVASAMQSTEPIKIWNSAPPKPRAGTITYADGVNWNPGYGEGPYVYASDNNWHPMSANAAYGVYAPWTPYTPGISVIAGSWGATATGRYKILGKICFVSIQLTVTSFTTADYPSIGLPVQSVSVTAIPQQYLVGREINTTGVMLACFIPAASTAVSAITYNNGYPITSASCILNISGAYETV